jgi:alkylation response protein AidB-like acyl-CoA dehydrogenase
MREGSRAMQAGLDNDILEMTIAAIGEFADKEFPDQRLLALDAADEAPIDAIRAMCSDQLGIHLLFIPEEYGGIGGNSFDVYRVCERLAGVDLGLATGLFATFLGSDPITVGGTDVQKKEWLTRIAEEGLLFAYGATVPEAGSDVGAR